MSLPSGLQELADAAGEKWTQVIRITSADAANRFGFKPTDEELLETHMLMKTFLEFQSRLKILDIEVSVRRTMLFPHRDPLVAVHERSRALGRKLDQTAENFFLLNDPTILASDEDLGYDYGRSLVLLHKALDGLIQLGRDGVRTAPEEFDHDYLNTLFDIMSMEKARTKKHGKTTEDVRWKDRICGIVQAMFHVVEES